MTSGNQYKKKLIEELKNKKYRDAYVSSSIDVGIAFQIRSLRKTIPWTQAELAQKADMGGHQERISALENPSHSPTLDTLKKIANAFDVGLIVRFVSISELVKWDLSISPESLKAASFNDDSCFKEIQQGTYDESSMIIDQQFLSTEISILDCTKVIWGKSSVIGYPIPHVDVTKEEDLLPFQEAA